MADQIKKLSAGHSIEVLDAIMTEVEEARGTYGSLNERLDDMDSSSFSPTPAQLAAVNSGINSEKVEQIETNKNNISKDEAALVELVDSGAKNLFNPSDYTVLNSASGVTITPNGDGTYTLSGAASGSTADFLYTTPNVYTKMYGLKAGGTYTIVSGDDKVLIRIDATTNPSSQWNRNLVTNVANKATFTIPDNIVGLWIRIRVPIVSGNVDNVIVTPMICTKAAWGISQAYQPYRPSYQELYEMVKALQANQ